MNSDGIANVCDKLGLNYGRFYSGTARWGSHMSISCPLAISKHGDPRDENLSCSVSVDENDASRAKCWSGNCGFKGSFLNLLREAVRLRGSPPDLVELLKEVEAIESPNLPGKLKRVVQKIQQEQTTKAQPRDRDVLPESAFASFAGKIPYYAVTRGITVETAKEWGLGYDKDGHFLVFPIRRRDGALVGMVGRATSKSAKRRHHNYMGLDKARHLFGANKLQPGKPVVIVESCIDALNTWQALGKEVCVTATLGEGFSAAQALLLSAIRPTFVYIFTDGDPPGRLIGEKIAHGLYGILPVKLMECPWGPITGYTEEGRPIHDKVDPSDLPPEYISDLYKKARTVLKMIKWTDPPVIYVKPKKETPTVSGDIVS